MKLGEKLTIEFINTPLRDVIAFLQEKSKMNFFLDKDVLDANVNIKLNDVPLSVILGYVLPKGLSYYLSHSIGYFIIFEKRQDKFLFSFNRFKIKYSPLF